MPCLYLNKWYITKNLPLIYTNVSTNISFFRFKVKNSYLRLFK